MPQIALVGPTHPLKGGGIVTFNEILARTLLEKRNSLKIFTFSLQYPGFLFPGKTQLSEDPAPQGLDIEVSINSIDPLSWLRVGKRIKKLRPDLLIIRYWIPFMAPCLGTIARIAKRNGHTRVIAITDNVVPHEHSLLDRSLTQYFVNSCDGFITMARAVLEDLNKFDTEKPRKLCFHPLYDNYGKKLNKAEALSKLGLDPGFKYLLFFGFIRDYKGLDILLESMTYLKHQNIKLIVAGEYYQDEGPYQEIIKKHQLEHVVLQFNGFIPADEVNQYFCAADIVVQPYKTATQSGITQIAYHFDKPMIVTDVGGLAEIVPNGKVGYVVNPQAEDIKDAILRFYAEDKEAEFSANAERVKQQFTWDSMYDSIMDLYGELK